MSGQTSGNGNATCGIANDLTVVAHGFENLVVINDAVGFEGTEYFKVLCRIMKAEYLNEIR